MNIKKVNAFTTTKNGGNPAGVVLTPPSSITPAQMKSISKTLIVSETAYVFPSARAQFRLRFFSPTVEVDLCGHATIATFYTLAHEGIIPSEKQKTTVTQETNAGILAVDLYFSNQRCKRVMMAQANPVLQELPLDYTLIAEALRIRKEELDTSLPPQKVSTGLFTLPCCITSYQVLKIMKPDFTKVGELCKQLQVGSFHVFTFDTLEEASVYHARNFAPLYGINEDPTTGTANGAVCSYLKKNNLISYHTMICEQGDIIGRPGRVHVEIENHQLRVGGSACIAKEYDMEVEHL